MTKKKYVKKKNSIKKRKQKTQKRQKRQKRQRNLTRRNKKGGWPFGSHVWARGQDPNTNNQSKRFRSLRRTAGRVPSFLTQSLKTRCEERGYFNLEEILNNPILQEDFIKKNVEKIGDPREFRDLLQYFVNRVTEDYKIRQESLTSRVARLATKGATKARAAGAAMGAMATGVLHKTSDLLDFVTQRINSDKFENESNDDLDSKYVYGNTSDNISLEVQLQIQQVLLILIKERCEHYNIKVVKSKIPSVFSWGESHDEKLLGELAKVLLRGPDNNGKKIIREIYSSLLKYNLANREHYENSQSSASYIRYFRGFKTDLNKAIKTREVEQVYEQLDNYLIQSPKSEYSAL